MRKNYTKLDPKNIFSGLDYVEVIKDGTSLHTYPGNEVEGKSRFDIQKDIGKHFGVGTYYIQYKKSDEASARQMKIRGLKFGENNMTEKKDNNFDNQMKNILAELKHNDNGLEILKQSYEFKIDTLKEKIIDLQNQISELKAENNKLKSDLEESSGNDSSSLLNMIQQFSQMKNIFKGGGSNGSLKDIPTNPSEIPSEFLNALGKIDYSKIPKEDLQKYISVFENFSNQLPLKQKE